MIKKIEAELMSIAHKILKLKGKEDVLKMHDVVSQLFERLSVLKFTYQNAAEVAPDIGDNASFFTMLDRAFNNKVSDVVEIENKTYMSLDAAHHGLAIEPIMDKIKDMATHMPHAITSADSHFQNTSPQPQQKKAFEEITAEFKHIPVFEPLREKPNSKENGDKKVLNCVVTHNRKTPELNDKIAFVKHLFDSDGEAYQRVLSELDAFDTFEAARAFIEAEVKPRYSFWQDKAALEERFLTIVKNRLVL